MIFSLLLACTPETITETVYVDRLVYVRDSQDSAGDSQADSSDSQVEDSASDSQADSGALCSATADPRIVGMDYECSGNVWIFRWELQGEADRVVVDGLVNVVEAAGVVGYYTFQLTSDDGSVDPGCCGELRILADCAYAPWVSVTTEKAGRVSECGYTGSGGGNTTCPANRWEPSALGCQ